MLRNVILHGELKEKFGGPFLFDVATTQEAGRALASQIKGFRLHASKSDTKFRVVAASDTTDFEVDETTLPFQLPRSVNTIHIVPVVEGAGGDSGGVGKIILGAVLIGSSFLLPGAGALGASGFLSEISLSGMALSAGFSAVLAGVSAFLSPVPSAPDAIQREEAANQPSYTFNGPVNMAEQGGPVPLIFGRVRAGSQVVSAGISNEEIAV